MKRFKIDFHDNSTMWPYGLYFRRPCWHQFITGLTWWDRIGMYETRDQVIEFYEKIKNLPEYLD